MKKLVILLLVCCVFFAGCGDNGSEISKEKTNEVEQERKNEEVVTSKTIDGITISTDGFTIEPYEDADKEYTKRIVMKFTVKNQTDSAFGYITSWDGRLNDGFKLEGWNDLLTMDLKQVPSGKEKTDTAYFLIDDTINPDEILVSYDFMDYDEEYWKDFGKIISGDMGEEEYNEKYGNCETIELTAKKK